MTTINELKAQMYARVLAGYAGRVSPGRLEKMRAMAARWWRKIGDLEVDLGTLGCDSDLITLGLAKEEGGKVVYQKFDLSGWDE